MSSTPSHCQAAREGDREGDQHEDAHNKVGSLLPGSNIDNTKNAREERPSDHFSPNRIFLLTGSAGRKKRNSEEIRRRRRQGQILEARRKHGGHTIEKEKIRSTPPVQNAQGPQRATEGTSKYYAHN